MSSKIISVVTGASGFVGSHLVDKLLAEGHHVKCILRSSSSRKWLEGKPVEIVNCGLFDKTALKEVLKGADYIYHVAGVVKAKTEEEYFKGNVESTKTLLDVAAEVNPNLKRFVVVSSQTACGPSFNGKPCSEETQEHPITTYGRSKFAQEALAKSYFDKLPITIVRPPAVFGERDTEVYLIFKTYKAGLMTLIGFDDKKLNLIHVADLVRGIYDASISPNTIGQKYFVASEELYTWPQVGDAIAKALGKRALTLRLPHSLVYSVAAIAQFFAMFSSKAATFNLEKARDFVQPGWTCDVSKAKKDFGFTQKVSLEEGIKRSIDWYKEMKWL
ncbi:MAG: nucleoside-diphosphate sugar epimerase [Stygiobacter sp. RIFOXYC12_FULL_38_8]|nr:MAG: nucleoside-diphosphate sugar epimerase [Stygiobacter sp. GWC2_38_9]OGU79890.1 MAG: nucleoside-diphosphate sugar epimerase [Stygiobacter sp. RIFOXYA12_FULL_38_9]OGV06944.1 MAG: nucleoside-diphosphate sugar epimerase [Stygiobacter sp. RIFOXYB2_FULL_37_11]OGV11483.1 MAG: nucleoside-diphosphate sugar epimerase [Stygiobacter sp. RIFOXYA2_FULL_38_8]OGV14091.1 MAG: nucleoside-diphosphate sugar epimerase [Stygiobacter sp. RIFOXYC2_FULL_38_25]OGV25940.1 MAG: nucleoside-diphosphate sugar epimera